MVNINGIGWKILTVSSNHPALMRPDGSYTLGCCDNNSNIIYIVEYLTDYYFKKVLCHELVHACMYSYDIDLNDEQEEVLADLIATYGQEILFITNSMFKRLADCRNANKGYPCN